MVTISDKSAVKLSMGSLVVSVICVAGIVTGYHQQKEFIKNEIGVAQNTADRALLLAEKANDGVNELSLTVKISEVKAQVSDKKAELRELNRSLARLPENCTTPASREGRLICDQIRAVEDEKESLEAILRCYRTSVVPQRCEE